MSVCVLFLLYSVVVFFSILACKQVHSSSYFIIAKFVRKKGMKNITLPLLVEMPAHKRSDICYRSTNNQQLF